MPLNFMRDSGIAKIVVLSSVFMVIFYNKSLFSYFLKVAPVSLSNSYYFLSFFLLLVCVVIFLLTLVCYRRTTKLVLIPLFIISSVVAYFMDSYSVIVNDDMINNLISTDYREAADLLSLEMVAYVVLLGVFPSTVIYRLKIVYGTMGREVVTRLGLLLASASVVSLILYTFSSFYFPFFRENKNIRQYINPVYYMYSVAKYANSSIRSSSAEFKKIGLDAVIPESDKHRELVILVVGESARSDRFSLNGYARETSPLLKKKNVYSFTDVWSCATSTADSVPCMFSIDARGSYSRGKAKSSENILDILKRSGVNILWLDNNSDSKGVALRVETMDARSPDNNPICDSECRDEGMLPGLQSYIDSKKKGDILIVLHKMGAHGPAYYKRYPKKFEKFTPVCATNQLNNCTREQLDNTYDNIILYTDYFLSRTIDLLSLNDDKFETAMIYISDHGESLGEDGVYLHGFPYLLSPEAQKHIPLIMWFGENFDPDDLDADYLRGSLGKRFSHENLFHTLLGIMEIQTSVYDPDKNILNAPER